VSGLTTNSKNTSVTAKEWQPAPDDEQRTLEDLVRRVRKGDVDAESDIFTRFHRGLLYFLRRLTNDAALAEDLGQEAFMVLIRKLRAEGLAEPAKLNSYLHGIARKLAARYLARQRRRESAVDAGFFDRVIDPAADQFAEISRDETRQIVIELFSELRVERDRQILLRYWVYDEDKATICSALDIQEPHFHRVIHRAKIRFRDLLLKTDRRRRFSLVR